MPRDATDPIVAAFERTLRADPGAVLVAAPGRRAARREVDALARAAGRLLAGAGLARGALVGLASPNGPAFLAGLLALRRAGLAVLLLDWTAPDRERRRVAAAMGASARLRCARAWPAAEDFRLLAAQGDGEPARLPPEIGYVKLTSGSTGAPRGILTPGRALIEDDRALASSMGLADGERILAGIPMSHSYGLSSVVLPVLARGSLALVPSGGGPFAAERAAAEGEATFLPTVPAYLRALVGRAGDAPLPASVRLVVSAGAPLDPEVAARFCRRFGQPVHSFYGASECGGICYDRDGSAGEAGRVGPPVDGVAVELEPIDGRSDAGLVTVRSAAVATGYHPAPDARLDGGRFRTRDLAAFRGGELELLGRADEMINVKGKKVDPREVEAELRRLDGVEEVAVLGIPRRDGPGEAVRAVVAGPPGHLSRRRIWAWCRERLAEHKIPRSLILVRELPRSDRGKLDREALRALSGDGPG